jgi:hypothetical protein
VDFGADLELREIIVGINCPKQVGHFAKLVRDSGSVRKSVTIFKARAAFKKFEVVRQRQVNPLVVQPPRK